MDVNVVSHEKPVTVGDCTYYATVTFSGDDYCEEAANFLTWRSGRLGAEVTGILQPDELELVAAELVKFKNKTGL